MTQAVRSKQMSERCEQKSEQTSEWPSTYVSIHGYSEPLWLGSLLLSWKFSIHINELSHSTLIIYLAIFMTISLSVSLIFRLRLFSFCSRCIIHDGVALVPIRLFVFFICYHSFIIHECFYFTLSGWISYVVLVLSCISFFVVKMFNTKKKHPS